MLPRAFTRSTLQYSYISPRDNLLIIDTASARRAEDLLQDQFTATRDERHHCRMISI
ncbi:MAG: recombination-associated protein RdgC [Proteobacteria bacterium]|nr:recombination-associated protein RdgC [Pseudomonadota bacterium]